MLKYMAVNLFAASDCVVAELAWTVGSELILLQLCHTWNLHIDLYS
jgi:hypothetical protein